MMNEKVQETSILLYNENRDVSIPPFQGMQRYGYTMGKLNQTYKSYQNNPQPLTYKSLCWAKFIILSESFSKYIMQDHNWEESAN